MTRPADPARERRIGWLCAALLLLVWACFHLVSRFVVRDTLTSWDVAALRYGGAFLCVLPIVALRGLPRIAPRRLPAIVIFAGLGFPLLAYAGYHHAPAAHGATIMAAGLPAVTALLGVLAGMNRLRPRQALGLGVIVLGSLMLAGLSGGDWAEAWRGDLLFLAAVPGLVALAAWPLLGEALGAPALAAILLVSAGMLLGMGGAR